MEEGSDRIHRHHQLGHRYQVHRGHQLVLVHQGRQRLQEGREVQLVQDCLFQVGLVVQVLPLVRRVQEVQLGQVHLVQYRVDQQVQVLQVVQGLQEGRVGQQVRELQD